MQRMYATKILLLTLCKAYAIFQSMTIEHQQNPNRHAEAFQHPEQVRYDDGALNLRFAKPGDKIAWGDHKNARPMTSDTDRALVRTNSGNEYLVGSGVVINKRDGVYAPLWSSDPAINARLGDITIGQPWDIENFARTSSVTSVELQYKVGAPESSTATRGEGENPFEKYESLVEVVADHAYPD